MIQNLAEAASRSEDVWNLLDQADTAARDMTDIVVSLHQVLNSQESANAHELLRQVQNGIMTLMGTSKLLTHCLKGMR
jgi:hypothetical protein